MKLIEANPSKLLEVLLASSERQLEEPELQKVAAAVGILASVYPLLRLDSPLSREGGYDERRENFKFVIDHIEAAIMEIEKSFPSEIPTFHRFTPGMYIREIHVPAGCIFTSVTHKTEHPFVISAGVCDICNEVGEVNRYGAPFTGITKPLTRRVFLVQDDMVFTTFHATDITDPDEWILKNTKNENTLPLDAEFKCFSRKGLKWQE